MSHPETVRRGAVLAYMLEESFKKAAKVCGVDESTIRSWKRDNPEWWERTTLELRDEFEERQRGVLEKIRIKSAEAVLDRLEKGDERVVQGKKMRVKISGKDAATIYGICTDKLRLSLGQPTNIPGRQKDSTQDQLAALREAAAAVKDGIETGKVSEIRSNRA